VTEARAFCELWNNLDPHILQIREERARVQFVPYFEKIAYARAVIQWKVSDVDIWGQAHLNGTSLMVLAIPHYMTSSKSYFKLQENPFLSG
jgi:hypothetical protein